MNDSHNLNEQFPGYKDAIHNLKATDMHFKKLLDKFEELDKAIVRSEQRIDLLSDLEEEKLKKERLVVKEEIFEILRAHG